MRALIIICLAAMVAAPASARNVWVSGKVVKTIVSEDEKFAGCLVSIDTPYQGQVPACRNNWLSFDCAGLFTPKAAGARRFDSAILAGAMGVPIRARLNSKRQVDGWCVVDRVEVAFPSS